jgi:hydrogenase/urease accessory protein HupE
MASKRFRAAAVVLFLLCATQASAHPAPFSYLDIAFRGGNIEGALTIHVIDIAHDLNVMPPERVLDPVFLTRERQRILDIITPRVTLATDHPLAIQWGTFVPMKEELALRLMYRIPNEYPGSLVVDTNLFPYDPIHQTFINIYENADPAPRQQVIFNASTEPHTYYLGTTQGAIEVMKTFIPSGTHHILIGPDHILFLVGLLLLGGSWMALVRIVTAFTIGHSITLSLAALNILSPPVSIIEPAIALSIVFVGADNLVRGDGRDLRAWVALTFGLVHGFGFANVLREFGLPREALGWSLFSFNLGVEIGQLAVVLAVASVLAAVRRRSELIGSRIAIAGSVVVIAAGAYWFVQRVFFPAGA